jgi:hypothetical protein
MRPLRLSPSATRRSRHAARYLPGLVLLLALALSGRAQQRPDPSQTPPFQQTATQEQVRALEQFPDNDPVEKERRLRALNAQRHKSMVSDANKLLKLARELEDEVSRTNPDSFTPAELRKVAQIEKLAHSVKEKMSISVTGMPEPLHLPPTMFP